MTFLEVLATTLSVPFLTRALAVLVVLSIAAGVIAVFVNLRGLEFVSDGLTHAVFPGLAAGFVVSGKPGVLWGALIAAVAATIFLTLLGSKRFGNDASVAIVLTAMFSIGVIIVSTSGSAAGGLEQLLFGHLFTVTPTEAISTIAVAGVALFIVLITFRRQLFRAFDPEASRAAGYRAAVTDLWLNVAIALVVVASSVAVGNLLVLAILIVPGAVARLLSARLTVMIVIALVVAVLASWGGLIEAVAASVNAGFDLPGGATVALAFAAAFLLALIVRFAIRFVRSVRIKQVSRS